MSNRIMICPSCQLIAALVELPGETTEELTQNLGVGNVSASAWEARSYWCPACDTPVLVVWLAKVPVGRRRELVGLPADLLKVEEEPCAKKPT